MISEFESDFKVGDRVISGTFTDFDADTPTTDPGLLNRVSRLKLERGIADELPPDSVLIQAATGNRFMIKFRRLSGVGIVDLDLERIEDKKLSERSF